LVIDRTKIMPGLHLFCAVLAWGRYRFIRFATNETRDTTLGLVAEYFEEMGAVSAVLLSDRMACLKNGIVANVMVAHPDYVSLPTMGSVPTSVRAAIRSPRAWSKTWLAMRSGTSWCQRTISAANSPRPTGRRGCGASKSTAAFTRRFKRCRRNA
jgi:hypothetical protein